MAEPVRGTSERTLVVALTLVLTCAYLLTRSAFLLREPFFDELFTLWITQKPLGGIVEALRIDSGPPLYYFLTRLLTAGEASIVGARVVSLLAGLIGALAILVLPFDRATRATAALLLVTLPVNAYFSTEARAYGVAATAVGVAAILLARWREGTSHAALSAASAALLVAAYSHYYGVLAFSFPLIAAAAPHGSASGRRRIIAASGATALIVLLYLPGFALAAGQPSQAAEWMTTFAAAEVPLLAVRGLSFAPHVPGVIAADLPLALQIVSVVAVALILVPALRRREQWLWAAFTICPALCAMLFVAMGAPSYFPMRFESVFAIPFVIWLARSIALFPPPGRRVAVTTLVLIGVTSMALMLRSFAGRAEDPYRDMATAVSRTAFRGSTVAVSGLSYLEVISQRPAGARIVALPRSQALHPGWREFATPAQLQREVAGLQSESELLWVGEVPSPEAAALSQRFDIRPVLRRGPLVYARLTAR